MTHHKKNHKIVWLSFSPLPFLLHSFIHSFILVWLFLHGSVRMGTGCGEGRWFAPGKAGDSWHSLTPCPQRRILLMKT